jgi:hypothetical protein
MEYIGFGVSFIALSLMSAAGIGAAFFNLGKYNIGGVENSLEIKAGTLMYLFVVGYLWGVLFNHAPFTIIFN